MSIFGAERCKTVITVVHQWPRHHDVFTVWTLAAMQKENNLQKMCETGKRQLRQVCTITQQKVDGRGGTNTHSPRLRPSTNNETAVAQGGKTPTATQYKI